ncbi:SDR family NAD(P)-dependent oxidoreductase [Algiphilus sp.]|uniref:SDR family NAD(P)-dependent oxidoreductase n=1 Tax=Algiphilus sp. TaxID=1872431 RepID=UPI003B518B51
MSNQDLSGKVAVVTGASRGAGKGIAVALGSHGATVYVTGRTVNEGDADLPGTVAHTAELVTAAGGQGIAAVCDHGDDGQVADLFDRVRSEQGGLDILVNNATFLHDQLIEPGPFWEKPLDMTRVFDVGIRSGYVASWYAAPLLVARGGGLVVFTSSFGARCYMHGPAYGAQKVAVDKFAADMAVDFKPHNVATASIWMGMLQTDRTRRVMAREPEKYAGFWEIAETPEFTGHIISALYNDPKRAERSGQTVVGAELAQEYGIAERDGRVPPSHREMLGAPVQAHPAIVQ